MSSKANPLRRSAISLAVISALAVGLGGSGAAEPAREKVAGIGGFFFIADDPDMLRNWYLEHLGIDLAPQFSGGLPWQSEAGFTVFDPFARDNGMIPPGKTWMINFRIHDLEKMIVQLRAAGIEVSDLEAFPHGKFATLTDPEGNGIQLWEPAAPPA